MYLVKIGDLEVLSFDIKDKYTLSKFLEVINDLVECLHSDVNEAIESIKETPFSFTSTLIESVMTHDGNIVIFDSNNNVLADHEIKLPLYNKSVLNKALEERPFDSSIKIYLCNKESGDKDLFVSAQLHSNKQNYFRIGIETGIEELIGLSNEELNKALAKVEEDSVPAIAIHICLAINSNPLYDQVDFVFDEVSTLFDIPHPKQETLKVTEDSEKLKDFFVPTATTLS